MTAILMKIKILFGCITVAVIWNSGIHIYMLGSDASVHESVVSETDDTPLVRVVHVPVGALG